jgi:hypothetical protein
MKIKHNKIKNTGLLFESLARQLAADALDDKKSSVASNIIKEFFNKKTELRKELDLYHGLLKNKFSGEIKAASYVDAIMESRKRLNNKQLRREKYNIIKQIKENFSIENLFSSRIDNYPIYASIYKLFEYNIGVDINNPEDLVKSKFRIVEHIINDKKKVVIKNEISETLSKEPLSVRLLTQQIIVDDFNKKYSSKLSESQKDLLREFINTAANPSTLSNAVHTKIDSMIKKLTVLMSKIPDDAIKIKVGEVKENISNLKKVKIIKDNHILALLRTYTLINEIDSHIKKHGCKKSII